MIKNNILLLIKFGLLFMAFFPLLPNKIKGLPLIVLLLIAIFYFIQEKKRTFNWKLFLINASVYIVYIVTLLYTDNISYAIKKLETASALLLYPLIFNLLWSSRKKINRKMLMHDFVKLLFWTIFIYTSIVFAFLINTGMFKYFNDPNFFRHFTEFIPLIGQHSIYSSTFLGLGLLSSIFLFNYNSKIINKILVLIGAIAMIILLFLLSSKGVLISIFISISIYLILSIKKSFLYITALFFLFLASTVYSPSLSNRVDLFIENYSYTNSITFEEKLSSTQIRIEIYKCSVNLLNDNWIIGYGLGDINDTLMECYKSTNTSLIEGHYNAHSQYFSIFLGSGIVGFILFLIFLIFNYKSAFKNKNYFYFSALILYSIIMLVENVLERQSGVIMFAFLVNFLYYITYQELNNSNQTSEIELL